MLAIKAVYDGKVFKPKEPIPVNGEYEVVITFTTPIQSTKIGEKRFSKEEKDKITNSLFGVLPSHIDLDRERFERLS
jgi:predicted DNA-binding antitoxin AbrB/MazE fold protein